VVGAYLEADYYLSSTFDRANFTFILFLMIVFAYSLSDLYFGAVYSRNGP